MQRNDKNGRKTTTKGVEQCKEPTWDIPILKCCKDEEEIVQRWGGRQFRVSKWLSVLWKCVRAGEVGKRNCNDDRKGQQQEPKIDRQKCELWVHKLLDPLTWSLPNLPLEKPMIPT